MIGLIVYCTIAAICFLMGAKQAVQSPLRLRRRYWEVITVCSVFWPVALCFAIGLTFIEALIDYAEES